MSSINTWGPHLAITLVPILAWRFLKLAAFARLTVAATLFLIFLGGMVTSHDAGLAVPDWPLSFGTINPDGWWKIENIKLEHGHRLFAQFVGLLTTILAIRIWMNVQRGWLRAFGVAAFFGVCLQGVLGGLRVTHTSTTLAIVHACTAQAFLCLLIVIAMALSPRWLEDAWEFSGKALGTIRAAGWLLVGSVYIQLILGAVMRHLSRETRAGLAFHDFPYADGKIIPVLDTFGKQIHFTHRAGALWVTLVALIVIAAVVIDAWKEPRLLVPAFALAVLLVLQICLGAQVIWLDRPPVATSLHVVTGAAILGTSLLLAMRAMRFIPAPLGGRLFVSQSILTS
jgi:cytochrome c oxidase assembly protein subunit 15